MKVILTAGHELSGFEQVHKALAGAGVAQAQVSKRDSLSINTLQQDILIALDVDAAANCVQLKPGKMWQDLAADILLGNLEQKTWGSAGARTLWLLDFWKNLDTQTHFVLVYNSPTQVIANALARDSSLQVIGAVLNKWKSDNTELLRFYHRNKDRALLVHINSAINSAPTLAPNPKSKNPTTNAFIQCVNQNFGVSLSDVGQQAATGEQASELVSLIADQAMLQYADLMDCYHELESAADLPSQADDSCNISVEKACAEFASLKTASINNKQLQIELKSAQEKSIVTAQVQADIQQRNLALSGDVASLRVERESLAAERDLLVSQLYQVQQELESVFLAQKLVQQENAEFKAALENASTVNAQLKQAQALLVTADAEKAQEIKQLKEKITHLEKAISSHAVVKAEQEKLTVTNKTLTEKIAHLEKAASSHSVVKAAQEKLTAANKALTDKTANLEKAASSHSVVKAEQEKLVVTNKTLTEENNLLLLQLHQVQEELENYYLKYQALSTGDAPQKPTSDSFIAGFWKKYQPDQITIDLRTDFLGDNWYDPEQNGAWAGPELKSTLKIPALSKGEYAMTFVVADAMDINIISTMAISLNGVPLTLNINQLDYPVNVTANVHTDVLPHDSTWLFELTFAENVSPANCDPNNHDHRFLAIKLQQLILSSKVAALAGPAIKPLPEKSLVAPVSADAEPVLTLNQFIVQMNEPITGSNWYDPEVDGRWAGPETLSTVIMPGLVQGQYDINLDVVDTIEPDVLAGMEMLINGYSVPLSFDWSQFPVPITARFSSEQAKAEWELSFRFPRAVSPAEQNPASQDHRKLAVRVQSIAFTPV